MNEVAVLEVAREAFVVIIKTAGPILIIGLAIGLIIALFQALTSLQEMTLVFVPKIIGIFFAILLFLPYMMRVVIEFGEAMIGRIVQLG